METPLLLLDASQSVECDLCSLACSLVKNGSANTKVARVTILKSLDIVIASLIAVLFLGEILNLPIVIGIILIVGGVSIVQAGKVVPTSVAI